MNAAARPASHSQRMPSSVAVSSSRNAAAPPASAPALPPTVRRVISTASPTQQEIPRVRRLWADGPPRVAFRDLKGTGAGARRPANNAAVNASR